VLPYFQLSALLSRSNPASTQAWVRSNSNLDTISAEIFLVLRVRGMDRATAKSECLQPFDFLTVYRSSRYIGSVYPTYHGTGYDVCTPGPLSGWALITGSQGRAHNAVEKIRITVVEREHRCYAYSVTCCDGESSRRAGQQWRIPCPSATGKGDSFTATTYTTGGWPVLQNSSSHVHREPDGTIWGLDYCTQRLVV